MIIKENIEIIGILVTIIIAISPFVYWFFCKRNSVVIKISLNQLYKSSLFIQGRYKKHNNDLLGIIYDHEINTHFIIDFIEAYKKINNLKNAKEKHTELNNKIKTFLGLFEKNESIKDDLKKYCNPNNGMISQVSLKRDPKFYTFEKNHQIATAQISEIICILNRDFKIRKKDSTV